MRAIWKGAIAFGLVNVPVKVYSATEDHDISLHQVHNADGGRIRYQRRCEVCSKIVDYADIEKAYEDDGRTVVLSREELKSIPAENSHEIEVVQFVPSEQLDPIMFEKSYYLEPDSKSPKAYMLLRRALEDTDRVAIVQFALRDKTRLGALRIRDDVLMLQALLWADEVREADFPALETSVRISAQEREMSAALVESMAADFEPEQFTDDYQAQLRQLIEAKLEKGDVPGHRRDLRCRGRGSRQRRSDRPDGGAQAQPGQEARGGAAAAGDSDESEAEGGRTEGDDAEEAARPSRRPAGPSRGRSAAAKADSSRPEREDRRHQGRTAKSAQDEASSTSQDRRQERSTVHAKPAAKTGRQDHGRQGHRGQDRPPRRPPPLGQGRAPENAGTPPSGLMSGRSGVSERRDEFALLFA